MNQYSRDYTAEIKASAEKVASLRTQAKGNPTLGGPFTEYLNALSQLAELKRRTSQFAEYRDLCKELVDESRLLYAAYPNNYRTQWGLAVCLRDLSAAHYFLGEYSQGFSAVEESVRLFEEAFDANRLFYKYLRDYVTALDGMIEYRILNQFYDNEATVTVLNKSIAIRQSILKGFTMPYGDVVFHQYRLVRPYSLLAESCFLRNDIPGFRSNYEKSIEILSRLLENDPNNREYKTMIEKRKSRIQEVTQTIQ